MKKLALFILVLAGFVFGQGVQKTDLQIEIVVNAESGWPVRLLVSGFTPQKAWLGYSFYKYIIVEIGVCDGHKKTFHYKRISLRSV